MMADAAHSGSVAADAREVTVVIPAWGSYVEALPEAVASARNGTCRPQLIVVDNASDPPITPPEGCKLVRSDERLSRGEARNLGLARVTTDYVAFLDADDLLMPGALVRLVKGLDQRPDAQMFVGGIVEGDGARHRAPRKLSRMLAHAPRVFAWANATWSLVPIQGCAVMRTAAVRACGGYADASSGEDWVLGASLAFSGRIAFDEQPVLIYRLRPDSPGGQHGIPAATLLENAERVRERLAADPATGAGRAALGLLRAAQALAVLGFRPIVRRLRGVSRRK